MYPVENSILLYKGKDTTAGHTSGTNEPHNSDININCACSVWPCKIGRRVHISPKMHPADHRSIGGP